ncbi:MAG: hypothetical protein OXG79_04760 [Chloroflexi bacterium]|nr:hypothetical protein [Chloroflexota bacterium]
MSIEIVLYPPSVTRSSLCDHLRTSNFQPTKHLWNWPAGSKHFHWFEPVDYTSFDGVEATVYLTSEKERKNFSQSTWALHTRTRASASIGDKNKQNEVIRSARRRFGGSFTNDWYGTNRYTPIGPDPRDAVARGIYLSYEYVSERISAVKYALPEPNETFEKLAETDLEPLSRLDPARVVYNALVPFAVAALEHFFSNSFKILLQYDKNAQTNLLDQNRKVDIANVVAIRDGSKSLEDIVANWYSFQSIAGIHKAYNEWLNVDVWSILRKRKRLGDRLPRLEDELTRLIEFRHGVVHRFDLNLRLRKDSSEEIFDLVALVIDEFTGHLESLRGIPIRDATIFDTRTRAGKD